MDFMYLDSMNSIYFPKYGIFSLFILLIIFYRNDKIIACVYIRPTFFQLVFVYDLLEAHVGELKNV